VPDILSGSSSPLLIYKDTPLVAAITISNDSFVVGMNKQSWEVLGGEWVCVQSYEGERVVRKQQDVAIGSWVDNKNDWVASADDYKHK
jgi:hypothetical protein